jgi:hypothetical protein
VQLEVLRELRLLVAPRPGRPLHLSAASGLVKVETLLYVVADDELHLGAFAANGSKPGTLIRMFDGELPDTPEERKQHKPDLEALVMLPPFTHYPCGALLALGSGSKKRRRRGVLLALDARGVNAAQVRVLDLSGLFGGIAAEINDLNIEGAVVCEDRLVLMHRGNKSAADSGLISFSLQAVLAAIERGDTVGELPLLSLERYTLGSLEGVPLCFTDGAVLPDGRLVFAAVAEDTADSYHDGPCRGAAIGVIGANGKLQALHFLERPYKIEGIHAELAGVRVKLWLVTDADDASVPATLLTGVLPS